MRFRRLDLIAYGHFTDVQIDLSQGRHGLHLIYGPNEAGKSSSLRALTDFLFGIPVRTSDAFLHPYPTLRIGGILENQKGDVLHCIRRKANQGSLRNATEDESISDAQWSAFLGDIHRELFTTMFGINHESLREGGEEIARGGGRTGEALFASASGLTNLRHTQKSLRDAMDSIFSSSGRKGSLLTLAQACRSVRDEQRKVTISLDQWKTIEGRHATAQQEELDLKNRVAQLELRRSQLDRIQSAFPIVAQWSELQRELLSLKDCVSLPEDFGKNVEILLARKLALKTQRDELEPVFSELRARLNDVPIEFPALDREQEIDELVVRYGEYRKGQSDLPRLKGLLENEEHAAREILREMGRPADLGSIEGIRIATDRQTRIQVLANQYSALVARVQSHSERVGRAKRQKNTLNASVIPIVDWSVYEDLRETITRIQRLGPIEEKLETLESSIARKVDGLTSELQRLGWRDRAVEAFATCVLPSPARLESMDHSWQELSENTKQIETDRRNLELERKRLRQQCVQLDASTTIPSREQLREVRQLRDSGLELLASNSQDTPLYNSQCTEFISRFRDAKDLKSALRASVDATDQLADRMLELAEQLNAKQQMERELGEIEERLETLDSETSRLASVRELWDAEWLLLWRGVGVELASPREMRYWLQRATETQSRLSELDADRAAGSRLKQVIESSYTELSGLLERLGQRKTNVPRLDLLLSVAERCERELEASRIQADSDRKQLAALELEELEETDNLQNAQNELETWRTTWMQEMECLGLAANALPEQAAIVMQQTQELSKHWKESETLRKRIQGIERDATQFLTDANTLALALGHASDPIDPHRVLSELKRTLQKAREEKGLSNTLQEQLQRDETRFRSLDLEWCNVNAQLQALMVQSQCGVESELDRAAERSRTKRGIETRLASLQLQIIAASSGEGLDAFVQLVKSTNIDSVAVELQELDKTLEHLKSARDNAIRAAERERHALESLDQGTASELASQAQGIAASIDDQLRELAVLRLCAAVLNTGIERFRDKNQGPMLQAASASFRGMTCKAFEGLQIDLNDDGQGVLVGLRPNQKQVHVEEMSDGTRDQLYLSLRMAAIKDWNSRHEPIPLVVDDILIHFDDQRSVATLEQLAELSDHTQVLFFTHHQHLIDLATAKLDRSKFFVHLL